MIDFSQLEKVLKEENKEQILLNEIKKKRM